MKKELIKISKKPCPACNVLDVILNNEINYPVTRKSLNDEPELQEKYDLTGVPVLIMEIDGVEVDRLEGVGSPEDILKLIKKGDI